MKKRMILVLVFVLSWLSAVPALAGLALDSGDFFPDAAFRAVLKQFDADNNNFLTPDEFEAITKIDCQKNKSLKSVEGISYFENLEDLDVCETGISSMDLSKNPKLKQLLAYGNAITSLDLSNCTYLAKAVEKGIENYSLNNGTACSFSDSASGSSLIIDKKVTIKLPGGREVRPAGDTIQDTENSSVSLVAEVNAANFPDAAFRNFVKTFDTDNNNQLSSSEVSNATSMDCSGQNIASLKGIAFFTSLASLNCSSNKLTELDISANTGLHSLNCSSNKLTALNISRNTSLTSLYCQSNAIKTIDVSNVPSLRTALWKGRKTENADYDYFQDPRYSHITIFSHGSAAGTRSFDVSYYLYVDKTVKVIAGGVTIQPSVTVEEPGTSPADTSNANTAASNTSASKTGTKKKVTVKNGIYKLSGSSAALIGTSKKNLTSLTVPATVSANGKKYKVTSIAASACKGLKKLKNLTIGKNVKKIGVSAFYGCQKLANLNIKTKLLKKSSVGKNAFGKTSAKIKVKCPSARRKAYKKFLPNKGLSKKASYK